MLPNITNTTHITHSIPNIIRNSSIYISNIPTCHILMDIPACNKNVMVLI